MIERFLDDFRRTKTKVITIANESEGRHHCQPVRTQSKSWQSAWNAGDQITVGLNLICWESAARFLGQSQSKVTQNQSSHGVFSTLGCAILLSLTQVYHNHRKGVEFMKLWLISASNVLPLCCNRLEAAGPFCCNLGDIHFSLEI